MCVVVSQVFVYIIYFYVENVEYGKLCYDIGYYCEQSCDYDFVDCIILRVVGELIDEQDDMGDL